MLKQSLLVVFALSFASSCVPQPSGLASARISQPIADAQPLLTRLDLHVPTDDMGAMTAAAAAFARDDTGGAPPFVAAMHSEDDQRRATDCLTQAVYYEARSEPLDGQRAVAQVVLNRVRDRAFPHSVCGVVFQGSERRTGCQFSFTCDGSMNRATEPAAWDRARTVAEAALAGSVFAPVGSATYYHANYVLPWWASSLTRIGAVGTHIFYRWRGALERALAFRQDYSGSEPGYVARPVVTTAAADTAGVMVHYATGATAAAPFAALTNERDVMVHRGPVDDASPPPRMLSASGVRVHLGSASAIGGSGASNDGEESETTG